MLQIIYTSAARLSSGPDDLEDILRVSVSNNLTAGVTGILLFNGARFLQVMEGPEEAVRATFARIERDDRHRDVTKLAERKVGAREFGEWAMAIEEEGGFDRQEALRKLRSSLRYSSDDLRSYLMQFVAENMGSAS